MDKKKNMAKSLEKNLPENIPNRPLEDKDIKDDYEFSRETYKDLIRTGTRSFEVVAQTIKHLGDTTEKLMNLQKQKKDLTKEEADEAKRVTNNNVFIGSTTDLQRMLLKKDDGKVIDATPNQE